MQIIMKKNTRENFGRRKLEKFSNLFKCVFRLKKFLSPDGLCAFNGKGRKVERNRGRRCERERATEKKTWRAIEKNQVRLTDQAL